jgi:hypothetical protein
MFGIRLPRLGGKRKKATNKVFIDNVINECVEEEDEDEHEKGAVDETVKELLDDLIGEILEKAGSDGPNGQAGPVELPPLTESAIQNFICPISMEIMVNPVTNRDGYTFEHAAILGWLKTKNTCPMSRNPMRPADLISNKNLKTTIMWYRHHKLLPPLLPKTDGEEKGTYNSDHLPPIDIPEHPDLSFLDPSDRRMIESAYHVMNRLGAWDYVRRYSPTHRLGYSFDPDLAINRIMNEINHEYGLHSGVSAGYTMRRIEFIAKNGLSFFRQQYIEANSD